MLYGDKKIHTDNIGIWTLNYYEVDTDDGLYLCTSVEMLRDHQRKARLTLVRPGVEAPAVVEMLRGRAMTWIEEYARRDHGDTV